MKYIEYHGNKKSADINCWSDVYIKHKQLLFSTGKP